jgi:competence protein ComEC
MSLNGRIHHRFRSFLTTALLLVGFEGEVCGQSPGTLVFTCLEIRDVNRGAGLAVVIETPGGKTYLYDTGNGYPEGDGWAGDYNAGRDTILLYLKGKGISSLDGVLISHAHYDHFGGLLWLADHFPVARLYDAGYKFSGESSAAYAEELAAYDRLRDKFKARPGAYVEAHTGDPLKLDPQLDVEVTAPPKRFFTEPHPEQRPKSDPPAHYLVNANSLGIRIKHGDIVFLLPGDIQKEDQVQSLLPSIAAEKLRCQILVAPGHGIHAVPEFAAATHPEVTIASVFPRYAKGIPAPKVYGAVGSRVFVTGLHGRVTVTSDGKAYKLDVERPDGAGPR